MSAVRHSPYKFKARRNAGTRSQRTASCWLITICPEDLERQIKARVGYSNTQGGHERLNSVTPVDVYFGREKAIMRQGDKIIKIDTLAISLGTAKSITLSSQSLECLNRSNV